MYNIKRTRAEHVSLAMVTAVVSCCSSFSAMYTIVVKYVSHVWNDHVRAVSRLRVPLNNPSSLLSWEISCVPICFDVIGLEASVIALLCLNLISL
jgi:hypothetical protein